ncbi:MFS transporter [Microbispora sp. RL4-1S]|uniref:MFS transporter n=1 Tax=Microbispora oryzae TaxID=2806554 RepID=A0A940WI24_9ACTN|nr:MFS transporter [Microbispora oryzae]MBP2706129.1 MFS transporter [Microbispora oryzae]
MTSLRQESPPALDTPIPRRRGLVVLPRAAAFWLVAGTTAILLAASSAPSPLYPVYQAEFGFNALTLTAIFSVYVLALLVSLLTVGRLSDFLGRRPVLAAALVTEAAAMAVFLDAHGVAALFAARVVQGLATGAAVGVLGAYLLDLQPSDGSRLGSLVNGVAATGGLGLGTIASGVMIQYAPQPTRLIFAVLTAAFVALAVATAVLPETVARTPGAAAALRPQVQVPPAAKRAFLRAAPVLISTWMLGGLIFSLGGSLLTAVFGELNHAAVGLMLGALAVASAAASVLLRRHAPERMQREGTLLLLVGTILLVVAVASSSLWVFVAAAVIAGVGWGPAYLGAFRTLSQLAEPHERAALISAIYVLSYLAFSIPALIAGVAITTQGLRGTSLVYGAVVALVAAGTLVYEARGRHRLAAL